MNYQKVVKIDKVLTILNQRGLHARAAAKFTETIAAFSCEVTVSKNNETVIRETRGVYATTSTTIKKIKVINQTLIFQVTL